MRVCEVCKAGVGGESSYLLTSPRSPMNMNRFPPREFCSMRCVLTHAIDGYGATERRLGEIAAERAADAKRKPRRWWRR